MTPLSASAADRQVSPVTPGPDATRAPTSEGLTIDLLARLALTAGLVGGYYTARQPVTAWLQGAYSSLAGATVKPATLAVLLAAALIAALIVIWRKVLAKDKRFHAPLLVTSILLVGDAGFSFLESHSSPLLTHLTGGLITRYSATFVAILTTVAAELLLGRFYYGKWPHIASAYVSGISAGILIHSPELWPFVMCGLISITSKYVLRLGDRHIWNPTNFGVTMMLFLAPQTVASLSVQAGNEVWAVLVIWFLGGMILYQLGRLHQPVTFVLAFVPLAYFRSWYTGDSFLTEVAPITSPMFQLYIFFMITDPKTTVKSKWGQTVVVVLVAAAETFYRLVFRDVHSLYHALFTVGPAANLVEMAYLRYWKKSPSTKPGAPELSGWGPVQGPVKAAP